MKIKIFESDLASSLQSLEEKVQGWLGSQEGKIKIISTSLTSYPYTRNTVGFACAIFYEEERGD